MGLSPLAARWLVPGAFPRSGLPRATGTTQFRSAVATCRLLSGDGHGGGLRLPSAGIGTASLLVAGVLIVTVPAATVSPDWKLRSKR